MEEGVVPNPSTTESPYGQNSSALIIAPARAGIWHGFELAHSWRSSCEVDLTIELRFYMSRFGSAGPNYRSFGGENAKNLDLQRHSVGRRNNSQDLENKLHHHARLNEIQKKLLVTRILCGCGRWANAGVVDDCR